MPRVKLMHYSEPPPIDWLHAAILERRVAYGYDLKRVATVAGVSYEYMRRLINQPTDTWPYGALSNVCKEFGIKLVPSVNGSTPEELM